MALAALALAASICCRCMGSQHRIGQASPKEAANLIKSIPERTVTVEDDGQASERASEREECDMDMADDWSAASTREPDVILSIYRPTVGSRSHFSRPLCL